MNLVARRAEPSGHRPAGHSQRAGRGRVRPLRARGPAPAAHPRPDGSDAGRVRCGRAWARSVRPRWPGAAVSQRPAARCLFRPAPVREGGALRNRALLLLRARKLHAGCLTSWCVCVPTSDRGAATERAARRQHGSGARGCSCACAVMAGESTARVWLASPERIIARRGKRRLLSRPPRRARDRAPPQLATNSLRLADTSSRAPVLRVRLHGRGSPAPPPIS